jgi:hypothetical protein
MMKWKFASFASLSALLALSSGCIISSDDDSYDSGVFHATWDVNGSVSPSACDQAGADKVSFLFTRDAAPHTGFDELFDCFDFAGDTNPLPVDGYTYVASLLQCPNTAPGCPGGTTLSATNPLGDDFFSCHDVSSGLCFVDLPTIDF